MPRKPSLESPQTTGVVQDVAQGIRVLLESPVVQQLLLRERGQYAAQSPIASSTVPQASDGAGARSRFLPPADGAPPAKFPVQVLQQPENDSLAPAPLVDRYPSVVGGQLTYQYVATVARLCTTGYRQQAVDLWRELLEQDLHAGSVLQKRILAVANGTVEVLPADVPEDDPDHALAVEAADMVRKEVARIPDLTQALVTLLWAVYYAVQAAEIMWTRDSDGWHVTGLNFVHSRRIAWPDMQSWDAYVWDQGQVFGWNSPWGSTPTNAGVFGMRIADWPGKFIVFAPQLFADYPTRDGLARSLAMWMAFKRVPVRGALDYLERFAKGFLDMTLSTTATGEPRGATDDDIDFAKGLAHTLATGNGRTVWHPDSIKIEPKSFESGSGKAKLTWAEWISVCNSEISKLVLGGTLGTEVSSTGGNRSLGEVQERAETDLEQFDATALAECLRRDLFATLVRLNKPEAMHLIPRCSIRIETEPDAGEVTKNACMLADRGVPIECEDVAMKTGFKLVPNEQKDGKGNPRPRQMFKSDFVDPTLVDPNLMSPEAKQEKADQQAADNQAALEKARNPPQALPGMPKFGDPPPPKAGGKVVPGGKQAPANTNAKTAPAKGRDPAAKTPAPKTAGKKMTDEDVTFLLTTRSMALGLPDFALREDRDVCQDVYQMLLEDYPASACDWVLACDWGTGPVEVVHQDIDYSEAETWRASHEDLSSYAEKLKEAVAGERRRKPAIFVRTPKNPLQQIVDGHHRTLASKAAGIPAYAYCARVQTENGPWRAMHSRQIGRSSKTYGKPVPSSYVYEGDGEMPTMADHDDEAVAAE